MTTLVLHAPVTRRVVGLDGEVATGFDVRRAYAEHGRVLYGFVVNGVGDVGLAEDCVQEIFLRAWRARDRYRPEIASERTWLFAIARNVVVDALRSRSRRPEPVDTERVARAAEPVVEQAAVVDRVVVLAALAGLSAEHREVIAAVQLDGMSYGELSARTGVPVATLRSRMFYGLRAFREALREEEGHG